MTPEPVPQTESPMTLAGPAFPTPAPELPAGATQRIGDYKLLSILGTGGMGVVYKAFDQKLGRVVALKMMQVGVSPDPEEIVRFRGEAETLGNLSHPNIVQVFDFGMHDGMPYLVMEYISGGGLDGKIGGQPQAPRRAAELIEILARAIHVAHEKHIIHRDLKPANVLLAPDGTPKISDFGLAKRLESGVGLTATGAVMGTPSYMAPEQARGKKDVGPRADVYALGAILYEMLVGRPPFKGATLPETLEQVCESDPAPPSRLVARVPHDLSTICLKCLHKAPGRRYPTAQELADDLRRWLDGMPVQARSMPAIERAWRVVARRPLQAALAGCAGLLLVALGVVVWMYRDGQQAAKLRQATAEHEAEERKLKKYIDAQRQHSLEAINGILDDLLTGPLRTTAGLLPLRKRLRDYYAKLVVLQQEQEVDRPEEIGDAFKRLGKLWEQVGEPREAVAACGQALAAYDRASGAELDARKAEVRLGRGVVHLQNGKLDDAGKDFEAAEALLVRLLAARKDDVGLTRLKAELGHQMAVRLAQLPGRENDALALARYQQALKLRRAVAGAAGATAQDRRDLARTLGYMGDVQLDMGDTAGADQSYWESHREREKLALGEAAADRDADLFQLGRSYQNFALYQLRGRAHATARHFFERSRELREKLAKDHPAVTDYKADVASLCSELAELLLLGSERPDEAVKLLAEAEAICQEQLKRDNTAFNPKRRLALVHALQARGQLKLKDANKARLALAKAREELEQCLKVRDNAEDRYALAAVFAMQAELAAQPGDARAAQAGALEQLRRAFALNYRKLHPADIAGHDRAFAALAKHEEFATTVAERRKPARAAP